MGIAPYKYFTFDGASSRLYDVYLTGEGVFNAPERAVEMIDIPGRNGNYALDHGKFNNITVTYKAGIVDASENNFADKMSALRNWLCSKVGYKRLEDDYNPNEYRMAVFKSGVTVDHEDLKTGEFEITFECKPQRWLTSGETATSVANNGTLSNPTPFPSCPLLEAIGYGDIDINGQVISIGNVEIGTIVVNSGATYTRTNTTQTMYQALNVSNLVSGDSIYLKGFKWSGTYDSSGLGYDASSVTISSTTNLEATASVTGKNTFNMSIITQDFTFNYGTAASEVDCSVTFALHYVGGAVGTGTSHFQISYDGNNTITIKVRPVIFANIDLTFTSECQPITAYSTKPAVDNNPAYIDCDIGEAYKIINSEIVSVNNMVSLPSDLPTLQSGTNTFTYDNTITSFKVTPRWWKV